jgi:hypothetical protein
MALDRARFKEAAFMASFVFLRRIVSRAFVKLAIKFGESRLRRLYFCRLGIDDNDAFSSFASLTALCTNRHAPNAPTLRHR